MSGVIAFLVSEKMLEICPENYSVPNDHYHFFIKTPHGARNVDRLMKRKEMPNFMTTGQVAQILGVSRDQLHFAIRYSGAPEPAAGKVGNRRIYSLDDVERLRDWYSERQAGRVTHA